VVFSRVYLVARFHKTVTDNLTVPRGSQLLKLRRLGSWGAWLARILTDFNVNKGL
jgi:hypothetical protein